MSITQVVQQQEHLPLKERLRCFYRGTLFQVIILGLISFTQPGIWSAISNLGAGGQAEPYVVNNSYVVAFGIMIFLSPVAAIVGNIVGVRWVLMFGTIGYVPYSAALYCNTVYGTQWFMLFGAATCGLSASALWTAEATIAVSYPEPAKRGLYIAIWLAINKIGGIAASAVTLALNINGEQKGTIDPKTYLAPIGLQCLGLPLSFLISPPEKVIREDGTKVSMGNPDRSFKTQIIALGQVFKRKEVWLLIPVFISNGWGGTYNGNFMAAYFSVRSRALISFLNSTVCVILDLVVGVGLDLKRFRRSLKAKYTWLIITALFSAMWIWTIVLQIDFASKRSISLDWSDSGFSYAAGNNFFYKILSEVIFVWVYWIIGTYDSDIDTLALTSGIVRSGESLGQTLSSKVGSLKKVTLLTNIIVAAVVFWASVPTTTWASWLVPDTPHSSLEEKDDSADDVAVVFPVKV
ncbi:hypothetical protein DL95DRAFT_408545 [Leptodontidium sp. 2 PMI_412]|nr:hypothetical protein DL95DRAFT_408545 [Leptodontidium sp. 2 PMI_412]